MNSQAYPRHPHASIGLVASPRPLLATPGGRGHTHSTGQWLLLGLLIYTSKVCWYDMRIILDSLRGDAFRNVLALHFLCLTPFIIAAAFGGIRRLATSSIVLAFPLMIAYGIVWNAVHGVEFPAFALQDIVKFTFVPAGFLLIWISPPPTVDKFLGKLAYAVLFFIIIKVGLFLLFYRGQYSMYYGGVLDLYPYCYFFPNYCARHRNGGAKYGALAALSLLLVALGQKRTLFVALIVVTCFIGFKSRRSLGRHAAKYVVATLIVVSAIAFRQPLAEFAGVYLERVVDSRIDTSIGENSARYREVTIVWEQIQSAGVFERWFGFGHGASFDDEVADVYGETLTHSVHFTPAAMLLRYGWIGVGFYLMLAASLLLMPFKAKSQWLDSTDILVMKAYVLTAILSSFVIYGLVDDILCGVILGVLTMANRAHGKIGNRTFLYDLVAVR